MTPGQRLAGVGSKNHKVRITRELQGKRKGITRELQDKNNKRITNIDDK